MVFEMSFKFVVVLKVILGFLFDFKCLFVIN